MEGLQNRPRGWPTHHGCTGVYRAVYASCFAWWILKIRYYGLLASSHGKQRLRCFALINKPLPLALLQGLTAMEVFKIVTGKDSDAFPKCKKGRLMPYTILGPV